MPFNPHEMTLDTVKGFVDRLVRSQKKSPAPATWPPQRAVAQETIAHVLGFPNWHALHQTLERNQQGVTREQAYQHPVLSLPSLRLSGHHITISPSSRHQDQDEFHWTEQDAIALIGERSTRFDLLSKLAYQQSWPILWLRSNEAHDYRNQSSGFGFTRVNDHNFHGVVDIVLRRWSGSRISDMIMSMLEETNPMWRGRVEELIRPLMDALVHMRENDGLLLNAKSLRETLLLEQVERVSRRLTVPVELRDRIKSYLRSIPDFQQDKPANMQPERTMDMHGFVQMQLTRILAVADDLARSYPMNFRHIISMDEITRGPPGTVMTERMALLIAHIEVWLEDNPDGILIFDGVPEHSPVLGMIEAKAHAWMSSPAWARVLIGADTQVSDFWKRRLVMDQNHSRAEE
jgi:hypothetical protein